MDLDPDYEKESTFCIHEMILHCTHLNKTFPSMLAAEWFETVNQFNENLTSAAHSKNEVCTS